MAHHICIHDDYCTFDGELIPFGRESIEVEVTRSINEILDLIVHKIQEDDVVVCGAGDARRMLGRKLEDRLKRVVVYE
jgi:ribulose 1,5-bisphosphate synthetase/thiazole synthase